MKLKHLEVDSFIWICEEKLTVQIGMGSKRLKLKCDCKEDYDSIINRLFEIGWFWEASVIP